MSAPNSQVTNTIPVLINGRCKSLGIPLLSPPLVSEGLPWFWCPPGCFSYRLLCSAGQSHSPSGFSFEAFASDVLRPSHTLFKVLLRGSSAPQGSESCPRRQNLNATVLQSSVREKELGYSDPHLQAPERGNQPPDVKHGGGCALKLDRKRPWGTQGNLFCADTLHHTAMASGAQETRPSQDRHSMLYRYLSPVSQAHPCKLPESTKM